MNIYENDGAEGVIDIRRARDELAGVSLIHDAAIRRQNIAEISAAALLDIAASLRAVAADARLGLDDFAAAVVTAAEPATETSEDFFVVGDRVRLASASPTEGYIATIASFGVSEGASYANVTLPDGASSKAWISELVRVMDSETDDESGDDGYDPLKIVAEIDGALEAAVEDDIDSDFDGDAHPAAASALDLLKANEAERKAKKKGSKK